MANLRDQLLQAGLIDKKAKHLAEQEARAKAKAAKADARVAEQLAAEKAERERRYAEELEARRQADREREAKRQEQLRELEKMHRLESTIDRNKVYIREGRRRFFFRLPTLKVGHLNLQNRQCELLEDGEIAVVFHPTDSKHFQLMNSDGVPELLSIDPNALLFFAPLWKPLPEPGAPQPPEAEAPPAPAAPETPGTEAPPADAAPTSAPEPTPPTAALEPASLETPTSPPPDLDEPASLPAEPASPEPGPLDAAPTHP